MWPCLEITPSGEKVDFWREKVRKFHDYLETLWVLRPVASPKC
jgi:hypothetical protein